MSSRWKVLLCLAAVAVCAVCQPSVLPRSRTIAICRPLSRDDAPGTGNLRRDGNGTTDKGRAVQSIISYYGGPIMLGTVNVYLLWYGNWNGNSATAILSDFVRSLGACVAAVSRRCCLLHAGIVK